MPAATQQAPKIVSSDFSGSVAYQGWSVAISADGETMIVGAPFADSGDGTEPLLRVGAAYVFIWDGDQWVQEQKLPPDGAASSAVLCGWSVALSDDGNTAAVGGPIDGGTEESGFPPDSPAALGAVWVWSRSEGFWTLEEKLSDFTTETAAYGFSVALSPSGDVLAVGDPLARTTPGPRGRVWIYRRNGGWTNEATLDIGAEGFSLGESVAFAGSDDVLIMGAPTESEFDESGSPAHGTAWTATYDGSWSVVLIAIDVADNFRLGRRVAASATTLAVAGSYWPAMDGNEYLWVFTTEDPEAGWSLEATLTPSWSLSNGRVASVAISADGNMLVVGNSSASSELCELWVREGGGWSSLGTFEADDLSAPTSFGWSVSMSPDSAVLAVGGPIDSSQIGAAWSFELAAVTPTEPGAPTLTAASPGNANVALLWSPPASNGGSVITNYKVYRGTTSGGETLLTTVGNVGGYIDETVTNGTTYYYKVSAVNAVGEGPLSNELSATPTAPEVTVSFEGVRIPLHAPPA